MAILTAQTLHKRRTFHVNAIAAIDAELLHRGAPTATKPDATKPNVATIVATTRTKRGTNFSRAEILAMLAEGPKLLREIATLFGDRVTPANANQLSTMLWRMTTAGQIRKLADGRYRRVKRSS